MHSNVMCLFVTKTSVCYAGISSVCGRSTVMCMLSFSGSVVGFSPTYRRTQPIAQRMRMMGRRSRMSVRLRMRFPSCSESCVYGSY